MSGGLLVTSQELLDKASDCDSEATNLEAKLSDLNNFAFQMESIWGGPAMNRFKTLMDDFTRYGEQIRQALTDIAGGLRRNAGNYIDTEGGNTNDINNVAAIIPGINL